MDRLAPKPEDSGDEPLSTIEIGFALPVFITRDQDRRLAELIAEIVDAPCNQLVEGVHWLAEMGSKPTAEFFFADLDGEPSGKPMFDISTYVMRSSAREFVSEKERARELDRRAKRAGQ